MTTIWDPVSKTLKTIVSLESAMSTSTRGSEYSGSGEGEEVSSGGS